MARDRTAPGADARRTETTDRYLETIYYIDHEGEIVRPGRLAEWLGVSPPTVSVRLQRLAGDGLVLVHPDRSVSLSPDGEAAAHRIVRRHRIIERWLTDVLGLDWATADQEAADLGHGISEIVLDRLDAHLGHPSTCPHGNVIPGRRPPRGRPLIRLIDLEPGREALVARISEVAEHEAPQLLGQLHGLGIAPGTVVTLTGSGDAGWCLHVSGAETPVADPLARAIWVQQPASSGGLDQCPPQPLMS